MPTSDFANIPAIIAEVERICPKRMIELGIGAGKYGALCREALDGAKGRVYPTLWQHGIYGVEAFHAYVNPCWECYSAVLRQDFTEKYKQYSGYDLVMMIDSLEHVEKDKALEILDYLVANNKFVIISVPLGKCPQGPVFGNAFEEHKSTWDGTEFKRYNYRLLYRGVCEVVVIYGVKYGRML